MNAKNRYSLNDSFARVVELACHVEDRDRSDQAALRKTAKWVDARRARRTVTNPSPVVPYLVELVEETRA